MCFVRSMLWTTSWRKNVGRHTSHELAIKFVPDASVGDVVEKRNRTVRYCRYRVSVLSKSFRWAVITSVFQHKLVLNQIFMKCSYSSLNKANLTIEIAVIVAYHPCAETMLIFSVSFQFLRMTIKVFSSICPSNVTSLIPVAQVTKDWTNSFQFNRYISLRQRWMNLTVHGEQRFVINNLKYTNGLSHRQRCSWRQKYTSFVSDAVQIGPICTASEWCTWHRLLSRERGGRSRFRLEKCQATRRWFFQLLWHLKRRHRALCLCRRRWWRVWAFSQTKVAFLSDNTTAYVLVSFSTWQIANCNETLHDIHKWYPECVCLQRYEIAFSIFTMMMFVFAFEADTLLECLSDNYLHLTSRWE